MSNKKNNDDEQVIKPEWQAKKVRDEVLKSTAALHNNLEEILAQQNSQLIGEINKAVLINKDYYTDLPIETPQQLVIAIAEYATNVLGISVSTVNTSTKATIVFVGGTIANRLAAINGLQEEAKEKLIVAYKNGLADLGAAYGFVTHVTTAQPDFIVTFSK